MKKTILFLICLIYTCFSIYALTLKTGESTKYFPVSAPMVGNKSGDRSSCFITKISKANGYSNGTYEIQLTSCDWIGATVFPVTFTYLLKPGDTIELKNCVSMYTTPEVVKFTVNSIKENNIVLDEVKSNLGEITPSEDSL